MRRQLITLTTALTVLLVAPASAGASDSQFKARLRLTSSRPGTPAGAVLNLVRPDGPDGKPKTEAVGVFQLPPGTVINQNAVPPCTKDDATWQAEGPGACPDSYVGNGFATLYSGLGPPVDPLAIDEHWYYAPGQIVALYTLHAQTTPVLELGHVQIRGATFVAPLDLPPGYPPGTKTAPKETDVTLDSYVGPHGAFITTPRTCPRDRKWTTTVTLHYDDGSTDSVSDATPCRRPRARRHTHDLRRAAAAAAGTTNGVNHARHFRGYRLYYSGEQLDSLPLTTVLERRYSRRKPANWSFIYGDCTPDQSEDPPSCTAPYEIQDWPICERNPARYERDARSRRIGRVRGAPVYLHTFDGTWLELYTGRTTVAVWGPSVSADMRALQSLRAVNGRGAASDPLPPPSRRALRGRLHCR